MRQARPVYHRKRDSIEAHLTVVFVALAVNRWIERQSSHLIAAADPLSNELRQALELTNGTRWLAH